MLPDTSKTFLDQCKQQGMKFEDVASQLAPAGWSPEQIELAGKYYSPEAAVPQAAAISPDTTPVIPEAKKGRGGLKIASFMFFGLVFLLAATGIPAYFVATEKLNIGSEAFKSAVTSLVFSIPFIPKTPKYILLSAAGVQKKLSKNSFDVSITAESNDFKTIIGGNSLDTQLSGYIDYSDVKNPRFSLTINVTKEFSAEIKKNDKMVYFKIDKLPPAVAALLGMDPDKTNSILDNWVAYDTTSLNNPVSATNAGAMKFLTRLMNEDILPQIKITSEKLDKFSTYRLEFAPDASTLDKIGADAEQEAINQAGGSSPVKGKLSDYVKNLDFNVWIDSSRSYIRKGTVTFTLDPGSSTSAANLVSNLPIPTTVKSPVTVSITLVMSDFGKTIQVQVPDKSITPEEIYKQITENSSMFNATGSGR